jgi:hypothetical protein
VARQLREADFVVRPQAWPLVVFRTYPYNRPADWPTEEEEFALLIEVGKELKR